MIDHIVKARSMKEIRDVVNIIKNKLGLYNEIKFPIMYFFEHIIPNLFPDYKFIIVEDKELGGLEACTDHNSKIVKIKERVYLGAINGYPKDLFTIAHEIGHLFLHKGEAVVFARTNARFPAYVSAEWQANYFAAELLMASHLIIDMSDDEVAKLCNVSKQSARIQLKHAKSERQKGRL